MGDPGAPLANREPPGAGRCSIEDASGNPDAPIFEIGYATERIAAAAAAARALPFPFTLTGRTENFLRGRLDLEDTIKRLKAYEARRGADALMAPGLLDLEAVRAVCAAVGKPFNSSTSWWGSRASRSQSRL